VLDLRVLTAGVLASASTDLLQSPWVDQIFEHFKKAPFDYVVFDTPPLLSAAETQILASYIHSAVLVVDASKTPRKILLQAKRALLRTRTRGLGVVLNKSNWSSRTDYPASSRYLKRVRTYSTSSILPPGTPLPGDSRESMNGSADPNMTVTMPRRRSPGNEST